MTTRPPIITRPSTLYPLTTLLCSRRAIAQYAPGQLRSGNLARHIGTNSARPDERQAPVPKGSGKSRIFALALRGDATAAVTMAQQPQPLQFPHGALDRIASGTGRSTHLDFGRAGTGTADALVQGGHRARRVRPEE